MAIKQSTGRNLNTGPVFRRIPVFGQPFQNQTFPSGHATIQSKIEVDK